MPQCHIVSCWSICRLVGPVHFAHVGMMPSAPVNRKSGFGLSAGTKVCVPDLVRIGSVLDRDSHAGPHDVPLFALSSTWLPR